MAILWMDGFEQYTAGTAGVDDMLDGVYASIEVNTFNLVSTTVARTGTKSFRVHNSAFDNNPTIRRVLGDTYNVVGLGMALYFPGLPDGARTMGFEFRDSNNEFQYCVYIDSVGRFVCTREPDNAPTDGTSEQVITANAWHHVEVRLDCDLTNGAIEIRVNGVTVLNLTGINTADTGVVGIDQVDWTKRSDIGDINSFFYIDDIFAWAPTGEIGDTNNDFIGDRRVVTLYPDADTSVAGWYTSDSTSIGYEMINETAPDDETTFLEADALTDSNPIASEFDLTGIPTSVAAITAVQTQIRMRKTEAGIANVQTSIMVDADEAPGADRPITEEWTYWFDIHDLSPATGAPFTADEINRMQLRLARTE